MPPEFSRKGSSKTSLEMEITSGRKMPFPEHFRFLIQKRNKAEVQRIESGFEIKGKFLINHNFWSLFFIPLGHHFTNNNESLTIT